MHLVVDTSVIIAVVANEPSKTALIEQTQEADLFAPRSIHWKIGNVLSAMFKRQRITLAQAKSAIESYQQISLNLIEVDLVQALELAYSFNLYAYDAYIIACALNQGCSLLSLDSGLIRAAQVAGVNVLERK